jgi:arginase
MNTKSLQIIGVPLDLGAGRRGVDMGPSALRVAGLNRRLEELGYVVTDSGNITVSIPETQQIGNEQCKFLNEVINVCEKLAKSAKNSLQENLFPIIIGGDHSIAIGTMAGVSSFYRNKNQDIGLLWFDAHADFNTPSSTLSGNIHGMSLSAIVGKWPFELSGIDGMNPGINPQKTVLVGVRDIDEPEKKVLADSGIHIFTMRDIDERGMSNIVEEAIKIATTGTIGFSLSWDMDFIDPSYAPGVGTPVKGGASYREAHLAMEMINDCGKMISLELVEVNPILDYMNTTGNLAVELILSGLGKKII